MPRIPKFDKEELLYWLDWVKGQMQFHKAWTGMNDEIVLLKVKESVIEKATPQSKPNATEKLIEKWEERIIIKGANDDLENFLQEYLVKMLKEAGVKVV